jgi:cell cycle arrest protein BUB3
LHRVDIQSGDQTVLSSHSAGVKSLAYSAQHKLLISASWDSTLHLHHTADTTKPAASISLPHKPFSLTISASKLVVAMAARALYIYDLTALAIASSEFAPEINNPSNTMELSAWQRRESSLKFMTRAVACMPNDLGYASSSIEGRVAVEWFDADETTQAKKYAFKCHRQPATDGSGTDVVYPVNALAFHPVHGTFASGGGDGVVALWDGNAKRRIRQYQRYPASVAALSFDSSGKWLAIGISSGFEDGQEPGSEGNTVKVVVRELAEGEAKGKEKGSK